MKNLTNKPDRNNNRFAEAEVGEYNFVSTHSSICARTFFVASTDQANILHADIELTIDKIILKGHNCYDALFSL